MDQGIVPSELDLNKSQKKVVDSAPKRQVGPDGLPIDYEQNVKEFPSEVEEPENQGEEEGPENKTEELETEEKPEEKPLRVRRLATIMNLLNSLLGAGILSVPNAMGNVGIIPSVILLAIIGCLSHIATVLTIKLAHRSNASGLDELALKVTGKPGSVALSILSMLFLVSALIAYLIINFGILQGWFQLMGLNVSPKLWRTVVILIYSILIPIPLTFPKDIGFLSYCSYVSVAAIILFVIAIIVKAIILLPYDEASKPKITIATMNMGIFTAISIFGLAFSLPIVALPIISPYNPDLRKRSIVSLAAVIACFVMIAIPGVLGYLLFGDKTKSIILDNFPADDVLMFIVNVGFFFCVTFSYPAIGRSVMASWSQLVFHVNVPANLSISKRLIVIFLTNIFPLVIAVLLPDARPILSIGGAFGGCVVDFCYPGVMWVMLSKKKWYHWQNLLCILLTIFGLVSAIISTYQAVLDAISAFKNS